MSLQSRLADLITAVGADIKLLKTPKPMVRVRSTANVSWASGTLGQITTPFTFGASPAINQVGTTEVAWDQGNQWIEINKTGLYIIGFELIFAAVAAEQVRSAVIVRDGTTRLCEDRVSTASGLAPYLKGLDIISCGAGEFLQLMPSQNSGAAVNIIPSSSNATKMYAAYLGPVT